MKQRSSIRLFIVMVFVVPVTAYALLHVYEKRAGTLPVLGPVLEVNGNRTEHHITDFHLINQDGGTVSKADWKDKIVVVDFFFTHCPSICPKMTTHLKKVSAIFDADSGVHINSFSVDPERDSPAQLKRYAVQFGVNTRHWTLLTGDKKEIYRLARNSFMIVATDGDGGPGDFIHSEKLVLIDKQGRIRGYYSGTSDKETDQLINDIKKLQDEN